MFMYGYWLTLKKPKNVQHKQTVYAPTVLLLTYLGTYYLRDKKNERNPIKPLEYSIYK